MRTNFGADGGRSAALQPALRLQAFIGSRLQANGNTPVCMGAKREHNLVYKKAASLGAMQGWSSAEYGGACHHPCAFLLLQEK